MSRRCWSSISVLPDVRHGFGGVNCLDLDVHGARFALDYLPLTSRTLFLTPYAVDVNKTVRWAGAHTFTPPLTRSSLLPFFTKNPPPIPPAPV